MLLLLLLLLLRRPFLHAFPLLSCMDYTSLFNIIKEGARVCCIITDTSHGITAGAHVRGAARKHN